jgi:hypothetical protein
LYTIFWFKTLKEREDLGVDGAIIYAYTVTGG